jgi:hypothetical protein
VGSEMCIRDRQEAKLIDEKKHKAIEKMKEE